jgi:hypothetical protein
MKRKNIISIGIILLIFIISCSSPKLVYKSEIISSDGDGIKMYDKIIVYKINSKKDSLCYYKNGEFLGATIIITD